ncbi:MAG: SIS domain-containing protein [Oscillochloridaceae bacterium]|nr:SIS domain-containing protein [Chloroflexaceae bacterium]MDW8389850.1 SIS domain-containing protein [Oscillochloridaceae bacterium]
MTTPLNRYLHLVSQSLQQLPREPLEAIADALWHTYERDGTIFICGNGGSAATASHFACDLTKWTIRPGARRVRALALTDNVPVITAFSNDQGYADVFVEQLMTHYRPGDLLFAISGSGNSPNVLEAVSWANARGAITIGLTGFDGGKLAQLAQISLHSATYHMPAVEDVHSAVCHSLAVTMGLRIEESLLEVREVAAEPQYALATRVAGGGRL